MFKKEPFAGSEKRDSITKFKCREKSLFIIYYFFFVAKNKRKDLEA